MSKGREIRCYDYVNQPYERVRDLLIKDPLAVFQSATKSAASRARSIAPELRFEMGGIGVQADIVISVKKIDESVPESMSGPVTRLQLEWQAAKTPGLFPLMKAELLIYPLTRTETQLDFSGFYKPPLGVIGKAVNSIAAHRIAEVSVHRFVSDVAESLDGQLPRSLLAVTEKCAGHFGPGVSCLAFGSRRGGCDCYAERLIDSRVLRPAG